MPNISRRGFIKATAASSAAMLAASNAPWVIGSDRKTFKIGYVSPKTGPLAAFAEPDGFTLELFNAKLAKGIQSGGENYAVEIIYKDSQSNPNRAASATADLILRDNVDLVIASSTPATTNPVADQCELNGVPCITNDAPWQPYFFGRNGDPSRGFDWTYHFFWGLEDVIGSYSNLWGMLDSCQVPHDYKVAF